MLNNDTLINELKIYKVVDIQVLFLYFRDILLTKFELIVSKY